MSSMGVEGSLPFDAGSSGIRTPKLKGAGSGGGFDSGDPDDDKKRRRRGWWLAWVAVASLLATSGFVYSNRDGGNDSFSFELKGAAKKKKVTKKKATKSKPAPAPVVAPVAASAGVPADLAAPSGSALAADSLFRANVNGFSFPNWAGPVTGDKIDASVMVALFGAKSVCASGDATSCVLYPAAQALADQLNDALQNGRCEGMAVLSQRFFLGLDDPKAVDPAAVNAYLVKQPNVLRQIAYWWATQIAPPVANASAEFRKKSPSDIVNALIEGMKTKGGFSLGLYTPDGAHSVTPVAITKSGDEFRIHVYDNNYPNEIRAVVVNSATQTWTYQGGAVAGGSGGTWTGTGPGTLDITPMAPRTGPFSAAFGESATKGNAYTVIATPPKGTTVPVGVKVTIDGKTVDTRDSSAVARSSLVARALHSGTPVGLGVYVKVPVGKNVTIAPVAEGDVPVQVSVDRVGESRVDAGGNANQFAIKLDGGDADSKVDATVESLSSKADKNDVTLKLSYGDRAANMVLAEGQTAEAGVKELFTEEVPVFVVRDSSKKVLYEDVIPGSTTGGREVVEKFYSYDPTSGVKQTEEVAKSQRLTKDIIDYVDEVRDEKTVIPVVAIQPTTTTTAPVPDAPTIILPIGLRGTAGTTTTTTVAPVAAAPAPVGLPVFSATTPTREGFTFRITNYSAQNTYSFAATDGASARFVVDALGYVTVTGLSNGASSTVTVTVSRDGQLSSTASVTGAALLNGVAPELGDPTSTAGGYTVPLTTTDGYTYGVVGVTDPATGDPIAGAAATIAPADTPSQNVNVDAAPTGSIVTVTGLAPGQQATVVVESLRTGHLTATASTTGRALAVVTFDSATLTTEFTGASQAPDWATTPSGLDVEVRYVGTTSAGASYDSGSAPANAGTYTVTATVAAEGYAGSSTAEFTIAKKALTIAADSIATTYSGDPVAPTFTATGLTGSDTLGSVTYKFDGTTNAGAEVVASADAPSAAGTYTVTPIDASLTPPNQIASASASDSLANYEVSWEGAPVTIGRAPQNAWWTSDPSGVTPKVGTRMVFTAAAVDGTPRVWVEGGCRYDSATSSVVVTSTAECSVHADAAQTDNHLAASADVYTFSAGRAIATVEAGDITVVYGESYVPSSTTDGFVNDDEASVASYVYEGIAPTVYEASPIAPKDAGTYSVAPETVNIIGDEDNYDVTLLAGTLTISPLEITVTPVAATKVYGDDDPTLTYQLSQSLVYGDLFDGELSRAGANTEGGEEVGSYEIERGSLSWSANYDVTVATGVSLEITKLAVTAIPTSVSKTYGDDDPVFGATFDKTLPFGDEPTGALSRDTGEDVDEYRITRGTFDLSGNYDLTFDNSTSFLTIEKLAVSVTIAGGTKVYGSADPEFAVSHEPNLPFGKQFTGAVGRAEGENAGGYALNLGTLALDENFTVSLESAGTLTVTPLAVTVTPDSASKVYGSGDPELTYTHAPELVGTDAFSGVLSRDPGEDVGSYPIGQGSLALSSNYTLTVATGASLTITPATPTVGWDTRPADGVTVKVGDTVPVAASASNGAAVTISVSGGCTYANGVVTITSLETCTVTATSAATTNFVSSSTSLTMTGDKVTATVSVVATTSVTYGDSYSVTDSATGLLEGDNYTATLTYTGVDGTNYGPSTTAPVDAGTYTVTASDAVVSGGRTDLYSFSYTAGALTIAPKTVVVSPLDRSVVYGDAELALDYTSNPATLEYSDIWTGELGRAAGDDVGEYAINGGNLSIARGDTDVSANYVIDFEPATYEITPKSIVITPSTGQTKVYGESDPTFTYAPSEALKQGNVFTGDIGRIAGSGVGSYEYTLGNLSAGDNYTLTLNASSPTFTVTARPVTVTVTSGQTKVYGDDDPTTFASSITSGSLVGTDGFTGSLTRESGETVGTYAITRDSLSLGANYDLTVVPADFEIAKKTLTVTPDPDQSKVFGQTDPELTFTTDGLVGTDNVTGTLGRATGDDVGEYAYTLGSVDAGANYVLTLNPGVFEIDPLVITVTPDSGQGKVFGDPDPTSYTFTRSPALVGTDEFDGGLARNTGDDAGSYLITKGDLSLSSNYTINFVDTVSFTISKADQTISWNDGTVGEEVVYGGTYPVTASATTAVTISESGGCSYDPIAGRVTMTSTDPCVLTATAAVGPNHFGATDTLTITVGKTSVTVTADNQSITYGDTLAEGYGAIGLVGTDSFASVTYEYEGISPTVYAKSTVKPTDVGTYSVTPTSWTFATGTDESDYTVNPASGTVTIAKLAVTVIPDSGQGKIYGPGAASLTWTHIPTSVAVSEISGALTRATGEDVGTYAISEGSLSMSSNYTLSVTSGVVYTISQRAINIKADAKQKTYGDADPALTHTVVSGGLQFSDVVTGSLTRDEGENVGTYSITQGSLGVSTNYALTFDGGVLSITARDISVTAGAKTKIYGNSDPDLTYSVTSGSLAEGDSFDGELSRTPGEDVGGYAITQGDLQLSSNYDLDYVGADLTITKRPASITANSQSITYGDDLPESSVQSGFAGSEGLDAVVYEYTGTGLTTYGPSTTKPVDAGTYSVTPKDWGYVGGAAAGNYTITAVPATVTIAKRVVTVTPDSAQGKTYGDSDGPLTYTVTSGEVKSGDSFSGALVRAGGDNVGAYAISQGSLALSANYTLTVATGVEYSITQRPVTVSADAKTKVYGDSDPALTYQVTAGSLKTGDSFSGALSREDGDDAGTYAITQGSLSLGTNYDLSYVGASFTVTEAPNAVVWTTNTSVGQTITYGGTYTFVASATAGTVTLSATPAENCSMFGYTGEVTVLAASGECTVTASTDGGPNHQSASISSVLTLGKASFSITAYSATVTYGSTPSSTQATIAGLVNLDSIAQSSIVYEYFDGTTSLGASMPTEPGTYTVRVDDFTMSPDSSLTKYSSPTLNDGILTIEKKAQTISFAQPADQVFGSGSLASGASSDSGLTVTLTSGTPTVCGVDGLSITLLSVGTCTVVASQEGSSRFLAATSVSRTFEVTNLVLTVTATMPSASVTYGDALGVTVSATGLTGTDVFGSATLTYEGVSGTTYGPNTTAPVNVGSYTVTPSNASLSSGMLGNYTVSYQSVSFSITQRPVTVTADAKTKIYGDSDPALTYQVTSGSLVGTDEFTGALSRTSGGDVGSYPITQGTLALTGNYSLGFTGSTLTVTARPVTVTATGQSITYGDSLAEAFTQSGFDAGKSIASVTYEYSGTGSTSYGPSTTKPTAAGTYSVTSTSWTFAAGSVSTNYSVTPVAGTVTIAKLAVTVTPQSGQTKTYGDTDPTLSYSVTPALASGDAFSGSLSRVGGSNVGTYAITEGSLALSANYETTFTSGVAFAITKKTVTVTADSQTKTYGDADPTLSYSIDTLVNGDTKASVESGSLTRASGSDVGTYAITEGTLSLGGNYTVSYVGANLTITARSVTIKVDDKTTAINSNFTPSITVTTLAAGDDATTIFQPAYWYEGTGSTTYAKSQVKPTQIGTYTITATVSNHPNYTVSGSIASGTLTIGACATGTCNIGDIGPGGGYIVYADDVNKYYIEAALASWSGGTTDPAIKWGCDGVFAGAYGTAVGTGADNTFKAKGCTFKDGAKDTNGAPATVYAHKGGLGGATADKTWSLPSQGEMAAIMSNVFVTYKAAFEVAGGGNKVGLVAQNGYWSSTESSTNNRHAIQVTWNNSQVAAEFSAIQKSSAKLVHPVIYWNFAS